MFGQQRSWIQGGADKLYIKQKLTPGECYTAATGLDRYPSAGPKNDIRQTEAVELSGHVEYQ